MSTALEKRLTATQRATQAAQQAAEFLELSDARAVAAALTEVALQGVRVDATFAARVRSLYGEIVTSGKSKRTPTPTQRAQRAAPDVELVPRRHIGTHDANPGAAPDPAYLLELYGPDQLPLALARYKLPDLKLAAELVQQRNPGTKPTNKGNRDALIAYIARYVTGPV
jgi:hypothetical protein